MASSEVEPFHYQPPAAAPGPVTASPETDSWVRVASDVIKLAGYICETQFVPRAYRGNAPATAAAILAGRELGLPPMTSLRHVQVVEGSPSLSAEYKRARVLAAGHELDIVELSTTRCKVSGRRRGSGKPPLEITFTIDDARRAGLVKPRGAWETRPRRMLFARAATEVCDFLFADITNGLPTTELLAEGGEDEAAGYAESPQQAPVLPDGPARRTARRRTAPAAAVPDGKPASGPAAAAGPPAPDLPPLPGEDEPGAQETGSASSEPSAPSAPAAADPRLAGIIHEHFRRLGYTSDEREDRLAAVSVIIGRDIASSKELTQQEARLAADTLARCKDRAQLGAVLSAAYPQDGDGNG